MKSRYLLGAGAALAVAFSCAQANAQFGWLGGPYPVTWYVGPEGGWTCLSNQKTPITTAPFRVDVGPAGFTPPNGPFFTNFTGSARYDSGFNAGARLGLQYGPLRVEEEYSYRHNGLSSFQSFFGSGFLGSNFSGNRNTNSLMTNFIYDFGVGWAFNWPISPHIGFGVGAPRGERGSSWQNRGRDAISQSDLRRHLPEGKHLEFRISGDRGYSL